MVIKSLYIMVDTIFIGRGVGPDGLGAVSMAIPFFTFFTAVSIMIGIGGSALMSIEFGKGNTESGQSLLSQSVLLTVLVAGALSLAGIYWLDEIFYLMGARGEIAALSNEYMSIMLQYFVIYALGLVVSCFVRNDTNPGLTMYALGASALANVGLNYWFIFYLGWGIKGAAYGTVVSQILMLLFLMVHFVAKTGHLRCNLSGLGFKHFYNILKVGMPTFFIEFSVAATALIFNIILLAKGDLYITAYSILSTTSVLTLFALVGIGQACQPIISFHHGGGADDKVREALFIGLRYSVAAGVLAVIIVLFWSEQIASLFTVDHPELVALASQALEMYFWAFPFMGVNLIVATLFQAIGRSNTATILSIIRGFVLVVAGLTIMPMIYPEGGVWLGILFAEAITVVLSVIALKQYLGSTRMRPATSLA